MDTKYIFNVSAILTGVPEFIQLFPVCIFVLPDDKTKLQTLRRVPVLLED
jgi:hypothetical protein